VTTPEQINALAPAIARRVRGDAIVWFAYPKGTSKKYKSQIGRDNGWNMLGQEGFEPVRMVAIDEDWSAKRFRRAGFIKSMTRPKEYRLTERSKARPAKAPPGREYQPLLTLYCRVKSMNSQGSAIRNLSRRATGSWPIILV
jgi:hypothetical protein